MATATTNPPNAARPLITNRRTQSSKQAQKRTSRDKASAPPSSIAQRPRDTSIRAVNFSQTLIRAVNYATGISRLGGLA
jgi:hypothetical protein